MEPLTVGKLLTSAHVLRRISAMSRNGVPDAVLNHAKCLIVIPSAPRKGQETVAFGVVSCRERDTWTTPLSVRFKGRGISGRTSDLLIFLMTDAAAHALQDGEFRVERQNSPSPLVKTIPVPRVELQTAVFAYEWAKGELFSSNATGTFLAGARVSKSSSSYVSALTSFFNSIIPTGIVLHHTAVIPGQENLREASKRSTDITRNVVSKSYAPDACTTSPITI